MVDPEAEAEADAEDAAGCHPEGVVGTTTMEAHPVAGAAAVVEGDVVAVGVLRGAPHCRHHAYQYRHDGLQGWRRTRSLSHVLAVVHAQHGIKKSTVLGRPNVQMPRRKRRRRRRSQRGGVSPGLITGIFKTAHKTTKAIGEHQQKNAEKISRKRRAEVASGKRKKYAGESFNCPIM